MTAQPIPSSYVRMVARELEGSVTTRQLLAGSGLDEASIGLTDAISLDQLLLVLRNAQQVTANPAIGLQLGSILHPSTHGSVGWATINSPTLGDAIAVLSEHSRLQVPFIRYDASADPDRLKVRITRLSDLGEQQRLLTECALLLLHHVVSYVAGHGLAGACVTLDYPRPAYGHLYDEILGCPVHFDRGFVEYSFPTEHQSLASSTANADMYQIALDQCRNAARRLEAASAVDERVYEVLNRHIEDHLTLAQVAYRLNVSSRTLIRRLKSSGTSFQVISDRLYAQTAANYMQRTDVSVNAVSQLLGYRDTANFRRSFKRWFGVSPGSYRKTLKGESDTNSSGGP